MLTVGCPPALGEHPLAPSAAEGNKTMKITLECGPEEGWLARAWAAILSRIVTWAFRLWPEGK